MLSSEKWGSLLQSCLEAGLKLSSSSNPTDRVLGAATLKSIVEIGKRLKPQVSDSETQILIQEIVDKIEQIIKDL